MHMESLCAEPQSWKHDICVWIGVDTVFNPSSQIEVFKEHKRVERIDLATRLVPISTHLVMSCSFPMHLHTGMVRKRIDTTLFSLLQTSQVNFNAH